MHTPSPEKIEPDRTSPTYLKTIRGVGYRLDAVAAWELTPNDGCTFPASTTPLGPSRLIHQTERRRKTAS